MTLEELKEGDKLTIEGEIISIGGRIIFNKGDKVTIREIEKTEGHWSRRSIAEWIPERVTGFKLEEYHGSWGLDVFEETKQ